MNDTRHHVVVHYGELGLKGRNRPVFLNTLMRNLERALGSLGEGSVEQHSGRLLLSASKEVPWEQLKERLLQVFGVANFSRCWTAPHNLESVKQAVDRALHGRTFGSFRITARRAFKELPWGSQEVSRVLGSHVMATHDTRVDLRNPELVVHVEVIPRTTLIYVEKTEGSGGLPVGTGGMLLGLLSGGLDSPVAAYRMMKRGCQVNFVHFHSYPFLDRASQRKAQALARLLTRYQYHSKLCMVPFGEVQQRIVSVVPAAYRVVLYRRYMLRVANALAHQFGANALVTGESLGQVASQTLSNLRVIEAASSLPVLRPLIGMDKAEIMAQAETIGTYGTSILPDQDCCTLFVPRRPATRSSLSEIETAEQGLDTSALLQLALEGAETITCDFPPASSETSRETALQT